MRKLDFNDLICCFGFSIKVEFIFFQILTGLCLVSLQIMWQVDTFRAKVVDIAEHALTIEAHLHKIMRKLDKQIGCSSLQIFTFKLILQVTGDPGKMIAVERNLKKFEIREIVRTGKVVDFWSN